MAAITTQQFAVADDASYQGAGAQAASPADRAEAVRRVSAYFRSVGGRDEFGVIPAAEAVVARAVEDHPEAAGRAVTAVAMDEARKTVRVWLGKLVERGLLPEPKPGNTGLIVLRLNAALARHPEAFLRVEGLPEAFIAAVRVPATPALPPQLPGSMEAQPIELRAVRVPARLLHPIRTLNDLTHDLVLSVVGGR